MVLKCFQLLADALNQIQTLEQVLVPNFHKQIEAMLKSMSESKVMTLPTLHHCQNLCCTYAHSRSFSESCGVSRLKTRPVMTL